MMPVTGTAGASGSPPQPLAKSRIRKERAEFVDDFLSEHGKTILAIDAAKGTSVQWNLPYFSS